MLLAHTLQTDASGFTLAPYTPPVKKTRKQVKRTPKAVAADVTSSVQLSLDLQVEQAIAMLAKPIIASFVVPKAYQSDKAGISLIEAERDTEKCDVAITYEPWGDAWIVDANDLGWSEEGLLFLRVRLFWESFDELALSNNEREKWDILKWIFKPVIRKQYTYGKPVVEWHQNDEFFSFHNCCLAVGMDEDVLRDGIVRNVDPGIIKAVLRICAE
jgi:hypothetical protein